MFNIAFFDQWFYHIIGWPIILIVLLVLMYLKINWRYTTLLVPITLASLAWVMYDLEKTLGRPYHAIPVGKFMYIHHVVVGKKIDLFVVDKDGSRLYTIDNNKENREQLEKGRKKAKSGVQQEGEFKKNDGKKRPNGGTRGEKDLVIYDLPVPKYIRKDND